MLEYFYAITFTHLGSLNTRMMILENLRYSKLGIAGYPFNL